MPAINALVQNNLTGLSGYTSAPTLRGSDGTLYTVYKYTVGGNQYLTCAYSTDNGTTWTEVTSLTTTSPTSVVASIDSSDVIHVAYAKSTYIVTYRTFSGLTWGSEETIYNGTSTTDNFDSISIAVDSSNFPHVAWEQFDSSNQEQIWYSNRSLGSWASRTQITSYSGGSQTANAPRIAIDSSNHIYIVWRQTSGGSVSSQVMYAKYTSFWISPAQLATLSGSTTAQMIPSITIDSADNVHVVYLNVDAAPDEIDYIKYTKLTDTWSVAASIYSNAKANRPAIGLDSSNNLNVFFSNSTDIYLLSYTSSWSVPAIIVTVTSATIPTALTPIYPIVSTLHTNIPTAGYSVMYLDSSTSLRYYASSAIDFPAPQTENYSREAHATLPSTDSNLDNTFTSQGYTNVLTEDAIFEDQAATNQYAIFLFKNKGNSISDNINVTWIGKTSIAPSTSTTYLQIYNRTSGLWETLDSNATSSANSTFTLTGSKTSGLSNYYNGSLWVSCRIYQLAQ